MKKSVCENEMWFWISQCVCEWKTWSKQRSCLEVKSFKRSRLKFVVIRSSEERHLFNIKRNVMLAWTSNRELARSLERNEYRYQTRTRCRQPYIIYIVTQWCATSWIYSFTHIQQSLASRVLFLLLPLIKQWQLYYRPNKLHCAKGEREAGEKKRGTRTGSRQRDRRGSRLKKSSQQNRLGWKKLGWEGERGWSSYIQSSRVLPSLKLRHRNCILLPESKLPPARKTQDVRVIACLRLHLCFALEYENNLVCACLCISLCVCVCVCVCLSLCCSICASLQCMCVWCSIVCVCVCVCMCVCVCVCVCFSPGCCTSGSVQLVFCPPLFDTTVYRAPVRTQPLLGTSHPCVSPPPSPPPSPSAYPAGPVSPGNAPPPPFLPPSLPPNPPSVLSGPLSLLCLLPLSIYLLGWKSQWGSTCERTFLMCIIFCVCMCVHLSGFLCTCVFVCASASLYMWLKFCWL